MSAGAMGTAPISASEATRFEIVPDNKGVHARFIRGGNIVWWTESYRDVRDAKNAIGMLQTFASTAPVYDLT